MNWSKRTVTTGVCRVAAPQELFDRYTHIYDRRFDLAETKEFPVDRMSKAWLETLFVIESVVSPAERLSNQLLMTKS